MSFFPDLSSILSNNETKEEKFLFSEVSLFFRDEFEDLTEDTFKAICVYNALSEEDKQIFKNLLEDGDI